jgi:hypothetical protein
VDRVLRPLRRQGASDRDSTWTQIVEFDDEWRRTGWACWLISSNASRARFQRFRRCIRPGGFLYVTGHDNPEMYVLAFPEAGSVMRWVATFPIPAEGQAFSFDPQQPDLLYTVLRRTGEVIVGRVHRP